ncbi:MAG: RidA family protein [Candidatus Limnocylindrales bacterium]|jgi:enamine deaminase RidA (YjgF/YER057c/UK114 family)
MRQTFNPPGVPAPGGCYSQVVRVGDLVFLSGVAGQDEQRRLVGKDVGTQTRQALRNLATGLAAVGGSLADVCYVTAFLEHADEDFAAYNSAYAEFFPVDPPARATVQAHIVGDGLLVEVQAIAVLGGGAGVSTRR